MTLANYNPEDVYVILGGVYQLSGVQSGSFISISPSVAQSTTSVTADGQVSRTLVNNPTHNITLTMASTADDNLILTSWSLADKQISSAFIPIFVKDNMGNTLFYAPLSWVQSVASIEFSDDVVARQWTLGAAHGVWTLGGNTGSTIDTSLANLGLLAADFAGII